jgi:hypothetical protein
VHLTRMRMAAVIAWERTNECVFELHELQQIKIQYFHISNAASSRRLQREQIVYA